MAFAIHWRDDFQVQIIAGSFQQIQHLFLAKPLGVHSRNLHNEITLFDTAQL